MAVRIERTSNMSWDFLEGIIPPEYGAYLKREIINKKHITMYMAGERGKTALGYLVLTPVHYSSEMYELAHMQVVLEETRNHIGSCMIDRVVEDLRRNRVKTLCLSYDEEDNENGCLEAFFNAKGFEKKYAYCVQRYNVQQILDSVVHKKAGEIPAAGHFKSYDELNRIQKNELLCEKNININAANKDIIHFLVLNEKIVAMNGIYHMNDRIILDDIIIFDHSKIKETVLFTWSYFVEYVCNIYKTDTCSTVEIVVPDIKYEEASLKLIGEPVSSTIKNKMTLDLI